MWRHVLLLLLTIGTTTLAGADHYYGFITDLGARDLPVVLRDLLLPGLWYSGTILAILGCHEFGHYAACRYYDVDASLPFFLPAPLPLTGTLGAFIRIREPIPTKRMLFDIGIAGPIAGFLVALPALFIGLCDVAGGGATVGVHRRRAGRAACFFNSPPGSCGARRRKAIRSISTRWHLRHGSDCWRRR